MISHIVKSEQGDVMICWAAEGRIVIQTYKSKDVVSVKTAREMLAALDAAISDSDELINE